MLKIYGRANSINVRKVLWLCHEIGLDYDRADFGRGYTPTDSAEFRAVSPFGVVPVIDDDGFILRESNTIVRYLAEKHARHDLYPTDLRRRATIQAWMDWGSTDFSAGVRPVFFGLHLKHPDFQDPARIAAGAADWTKQMHRLEATLAETGPYLMGDAFTIADIPVGLFVNRWFAVAFAKPELPQVAAYYDRLAGRPAYRLHGRNGTP